MTESVIRHAVEEEARLMHVIMRNAKNDSIGYIRIMQEHNYVLNFFKNKLTAIEENTKSSYSEYQQEFKQAKNKLNEFISSLKSLYRRRTSRLSFGVKSRFNLKAFD